MSCPPPACPPTNVKFQLRRAVSSDWSTKNPALRAGEPGVETDTGQMKIGNESCSKWNDLPYVGSNLDVIRNVGLNAFIWDASVVATYDPANLKINTVTTFYGNSSYYDVIYTLSPSTIASNTTAHFVNNNSLIFNNLAPTSAGFSTVGHNILSYNIPITTLVTGNNILTLNITTQNAGGIGNYSTKTISTSINLTANDSMGNPVISINNTNPTFTVSTVLISGISYYATGTIIPFPTGSITFNNIYNIIQFPSIPYNFLTIADISGSSTVTENTTILYYSSNTAFPAPSGTNSTYHNFAFNYTMNGYGYTSPTHLNFSAINPKNLTGTTSYTGRSTKTSIGYIGTGWNSSYETNIPLNQNTPTISGITSITRVSIKNSTSNAQIPDVLNDLQAFNGSSITNYDCFYLPYQNQFYSNTNISTQFLAIDMPSQTIPSNPGVRYLTLSISNTAVLQSFTLILGNSSRSPTVSSLYVKWFDSVNSIYYGWYDGTIPYIHAGGCQNGISGNSYTYQININIGDMNSYKLSAGAGGGTIFINIGYTGIININDINIV